jgi:xylulose-5-phosphate/fructose-6-phosphate phosphoketolase
VREGESLAATALGDASDIMMAHPLALQLRNLQSLVEIGVDKNTTVVFPAPLMSTIGELGAFLGRETAAASVPTPPVETLAAVAILRQRLSRLRIRVVNVVDLMRLEPDTEHPHGLPDAQFDAVSTTDRPVVFAYHGYPSMIHKLTYRRTNHPNIHVRGHKEEGTTTTPFDMVMLNDLDRFHLVTDIIDRVPSLQGRVAHLRQEMVDARARARAYTREHGEDPPEISGWTWPT